MNQKRFLNTCLVLCAALALMLGACKKKEAKPSKTPKTTKQKGNATSKKAASAPKGQHWLVGSYEKVRLALAADKLDESQQAAKALGAHIASLKQDKASFDAVASAAGKLTKDKDIEAARVSFGLLSKAVMVVLATNKKAAGLQAYECPMAKGYKKWFQADADMANPYMGKKMLKCGGKTAFKP